jgi:hypothetical protein
MIPIVSFEIEVPFTLVPPDGGAVLCAGSFGDVVVELRTKVDSCFERLVTGFEDWV